MILNTWKRDSRWNLAKSFCDLKSSRYDLTSCSCSSNDKSDTFLLRYLPKVVDSLCFHSLLFISSRLSRLLGYTESLMPFRDLVFYFILFSSKRSSFISAAHIFINRLKSLQDSPIYLDSSSSIQKSAIFASGLSFLNYSGSKRILESGSIFCVWNEDIDSCRSERMIHLLNSTW